MYRKKTHQCVCKSWIREAKVSVQDAGKGELFQLVKEGSLRLRQEIVLVLKQSRKTRLQRMHRLPVSTTHAQANHANMQHSIFFQRAKNTQHIPFW